MEISVAMHVHACETMHVGKMSQRLTEHIMQHIPDRILTLAHLKSNLSCIPGDKEHVVGKLRNLSNGRSQCHMNVLEAVFMKS